MHQFNMQIFYSEYVIKKKQIGLAVGDIDETLKKAEGKKVALEVSVYTLFGKLYLPAVYFDIVVYTYFYRLN